MEADMTPRRLAIGVLGLVLAVIWSAAYLYQQHNASQLWRMLTLSPPFHPIKVSSGWSLLQLAIPSLLAIPIAAASIAALLGGARALRLLRVIALLCTAISSGTLLIYAVTVAPGVVAGRPLLPYGPRINYEMLTAACTLVLQVGLLALLRTPRTEGPNDRWRHLRHARPASS
jgi:hypothetical protein